MYLINRHSIEIITVLNPNDFYKNSKGEDTQYTNLQIAWFNIVELERVNWFEQLELPSCDPKYYKIVGDLLTEMNPEERAEVDKK